MNSFIRNNLSENNQPNSTLRFIYEYFFLEIFYNNYQADSLLHPSYKCFLEQIPLYFTCESFSIEFLSNFPLFHLKPAPPMIRGTTTNTNNLTDLFSRAPRIDNPCSVIVILYSEIEMVVVIY